MNRKCVFVFCVYFFLLKEIRAQHCTALGQNPGTAFPVCGTATFSQETVPACGGHALPVPGCENDNADYGDLNPFWYKFTCFTSGTLGFTVTPLTLSDDYDWQLFDVTGHDPSEVYTNRSLYITSNWSSNPGSTGTSSSATGITNCAGPTYPNKNKMPVLIEGHQYLLLVSHFTSTNQSGYKLNFGGGTANITDPTIPHLQSARAYCDGTKIILKLNKKMRCKTLAPDGSDFSIASTSSIVNVISANAVSCLSGFDMDSITVTLSQPLAPGSYSINIKKGLDGNTLLDNCDREIEAGEKVDFTVIPVQPTPMDSLTTVGCSPDILELVFKKPIRCNSIAANGSDFTVTGSSAISVISATGNCNNDNTSNIIHVKLSAPILQKGIYYLTLKKGNDGNTIIDECGEETPAGSMLTFATKDTVSAAFNYQVLYGCVYDTLVVSHPGGNEVNQWAWKFEDNTSVYTQNVEKIYNVFGEKNATLIVTNGVCADTLSRIILLDNELKADFYLPDAICPNDTTVYKDLSIGKIISWSWNFGNGAGSIFQSPPAQQYNIPVTDQQYTVNLIIKDMYGCSDTSSKKVLVVSSCYISIPSAFTPNGDQLNDYLYPLHAYRAENLLFRVYNLYGQKVFESTDRFKKWDGTINGKLQGTGAYVWTLEYTHKDNGRNFKMKGTTTLIR